MDQSSQLAEIFDKYFDQIYRYFYLKTMSQEEAEDLTSETFLALAKQMQKGRNLEDVERYLYGIARNQFYQLLRKKYELKMLALSEVVEVAEEMRAIKTASIDLNDIAAKLIEQLPDAQKVVLRLRLIERNDLSEICGILEKDMNYVKTTQRRGIASLKKLLACTPLPT